MGFFTRFYFKFKTLNTNDMHIYSILRNLYGKSLINESLLLGWILALSRTRTKCRGLQHIQSKFRIRSTSGYGRPQVRLD